MRAAAVGLHDHALHAPAVGEVVDVGGAEIGRDGVVDLLERDAQRRGLLAVDHQLDLRRGRKPLDIDVLQHRAPGGCRKQLVFRAHQLDIAALSAVLQAEAEAARIAEVVDRRRLQRRDLGVAERRKAAVDVGDDLLGAYRCRTALRPVLQRDERLRGVLALAEEAEAGQERHGVDARTLHQVVLDALDGFERARERGVRRRQHVGGDEALVVDRQEAARQARRMRSRRRSRTAR